MIKAFDESLDQHHEVGVQLVSFGQSKTFHVTNVAYFNPSLIIFDGITEEKSKVTLIQHVSQLSFLISMVWCVALGLQNNPLGLFPVYSHINPMSRQPFKPIFALTPAIAKALMSIEADRQAIGGLPLTTGVLESLRKSARLLATHYSTQIEGNRLTAAQVEEVIAGGGRFPGRERDETEVRNYHRALEFVETQDNANRLTETEVKTIHGLVMEGKAKPTPYRDGQNVIRDGRTGRIVYMPPEAKDVAALMRSLVSWINAEHKKQEWPMPILAAVGHYQFATIHPYFDGNGRTARLFTTLSLRRGGYALGGIYALEEYYAVNLPGYYEALRLGPSHNYYLGRAEADITPFIAYFCEGMADALAKVRARATDARSRGDADQSEILRSLTQQQRKVFSLFRRAKEVSSLEVAEFFGLSPRNGAELCKRWLDAGFLELANASKKARRYKLTPHCERVVDRG